MGSEMCIRDRFLVMNRVAGETVWRKLTGELSRALAFFPANMHAYMLEGASTLYASDELAKEVRTFHENNPIAAGQLTVLQALDKMDRGAMFARRVRDGLTETLAAVGTN